MTAAIVILALAIAASSGVAVAMAIRVGGLRGDLGKKAGNLAKVEANRDSISQQLQTTAKECADQRKRYEARLSALTVEIKGLEADVNKCVVPSVLRDRLERLLGLTATRTP